MRRIYTILIMLLTLATANAQLHGKLGRELRKQCEKGNIVRTQASNDTPEAQEDYKGIIRKIATKNLLNKCNDKEALQTMLDSIDSDKITIWEPYTTKGYKILHKQAKRLALRKKRSVSSELVLWKSHIFRGFTKNGRVQKYLGIWDKGNDATTNLSSSFINDTVTQLIITATTKEEDEETFYILCYTGGKLIYWSNKR